jgi:hypothetical protein
MVGTLVIDGTRWSWCGSSGTLHLIEASGNIVRVEMQALKRGSAEVVKATFRREGNTLRYCPTCQLTGRSPASAPSLAFVRADARPAGLVARWSGEGNANDATGNHHGTLHGGATFAPGKVGRAFKLDGLHSYVDAGPGFNLDAMTLDAWVFIDPAANTGDRRVISKDNVGLGGARKEFSLKSSTVVWSGHDGRPGFEVLIGNDNSAIDVVTAPSALPAGWHHLAGVRDPAAGRFELYVDGVLVASKKPTLHGPIDSDASVNLGRVGPNFAGEHFAGLIDEAEVFSRALTAAEVQAIYAAGAAPRDFHSWADQVDAAWKGIHAWLDQVDSVTSCKNHGRQPNCSYQPCGAACGRINYAPVFVSPTLQWAVPASPPTAPQGPPSGPAVPAAFSEPDKPRAGKPAPDVSPLVPPVYSPAGTRSREK